MYPAASPCVIAAGGTNLIPSNPIPGPNPLQLHYGTELAYQDSAGGLS